MPRMILAETFWESGQRCPDCRLNWALFPPVHIYKSEDKYRCIECKRVYKIVMAVTLTSDG